MTDKDKSQWDDNSIQFPRLIAEILAVCSLDDQDMEALCESMDLELGELNELFDRAQDVWDDIKDGMWEETEVEEVVHATAELSKTAKRKPDEYVAIEDQDSYPRLKSIGCVVYTCGDTHFVDPADIDTCLENVELSPIEFNRLFGIQTCPVINGKGMLYPWDAEAVLERMVSGRRTGTQMFWD